MDLRNSLFIKCSEATRCCDKAQYEEASFFEKLKIHLHIFFCRPCKKYTEKNTRLTKLIKESKIKTCTEKEKQHWKQEIAEETSKKPSA